MTDDVANKNHKNNSSCEKSHALTHKQPNSNMCQHLVTLTSAQRLTGSDASVNWITTFRI